MSGLTPRDVDRPAAEVEAEYLQEMREVLTWCDQVISGIRWVAIDLDGEAPDTEIVLVFEPVTAPGLRYGLRVPVWPLESLDFESQLEWFSTNLEEEFGISGPLNDARAGRNAAAPGEIRWLKPNA